MKRFLVFLLLVGAGGVALAGFDQGGVKPQTGIPGAEHRCGVIAHNASNN